MQLGDLLETNEGYLVTFTGEKDGLDICSFFTNWCAANCTTRNVASVLLDRVSFVKCNVRFCKLL